MVSIAWALSKLRFPLSVELGGTGKNYDARKGYIEGLELTYVGAQAITVGTGVACVNGVLLEVADPIPLTGIVTAANTFYHVYLYSNAGVATVEYSSVAPVLYKGTAYQKTGDPTRRYLASFLSLAANTIARFVQYGNRIVYMESGSAAPFVLVNSAVINAQTVPTSGMAPVTATYVSAQFFNIATDTNARVGNPDFQAPVSAASHLFFVAGGAAILFDMPLSSARTFQWRHDGAANGVFTVRSSGYIFNR